MTLADLWRIREHSAISNTTFRSAIFVLDFHQYSNGRKFVKYSPILSLLRNYLNTFNIMDLRASNFNVSISLANILFTGYVLLSHARRQPEGKLVYLRRRLNRKGTGNLIRQKTGYNNRGLAEKIFVPVVTLVALAVAR